MNDVQNVTAIAKGVSDYGMMAITAAFFLLLSAAMMVAIFKWFKSIISDMMQDNKDGLKALMAETHLQNDMLQDISEGLKTETMLRIRNLTGFAFDLSIEQVCRLIKRVRTENHIMKRPQQRYGSLFKSSMMTAKVDLTPLRFGESLSRTFAPLNGLRMLRKWLREKSTMRMGRTMPEHTQT
mgnify:CR=1 FL=1